MLGNDQVGLGAMSIIVPPTACARGRERAIGRRDEVGGASRYFPRTPIRALGRYSSPSKYSRSS